MNYFLSCGLARFANLGVFGPSPGNKVSPEEKETKEPQMQPNSEETGLLLLPGPWVAPAWSKGLQRARRVDTGLLPRIYLCSGELLGWASLSLFGHFSSVVLTSRALRNEGLTLLSTC